MDSWWVTRLGNEIYHNRNDLGSAANLYLLTSAGRGSGYPARVYSLGQLRLTATGTLESVGAGPSPVPLPAGAWLFGSVLVALAGVTRRVNSRARTA